MTTAQTRNKHLRKLNHGDTSSTSLQYRLPAALPGSYTAAMKISAAATVFQVSNLEASIAFYKDILGFQEDFRFGPYAGVSSGECCFHLCAHHHWKRPVGGGAATIFAEEVDTFCQTIQTRGAVILGGPADQEYGLRDFVTHDPDGNILTFSCPLREEPGALEDSSVHAK